MNQISDPPEPNEEELAALQRYANAHGRYWKNQLSHAWEVGSDAKEADGSLLRRVRNGFGGAWLYSSRNPITPQGAHHV